MAGAFADDQERCARDGCCYFVLRKRAGRQGDGGQVCCVGRIKPRPENARPPAPLISGW